MADTVSSAVRSRMMSGIRGKDTRPELLLRKGLHAAGFRYRLHERNLPGRPDLVLPGYRAVIFVNGCFWHCHDCHLFKWPATRPEFWRSKIERNVERDRQNRSRLRERDWRVGTVWECALRGKTKMKPEDVVEKCALWITGPESELTVRGIE